LVSLTQTDDKVLQQKVLPFKVRKYSKIQDDLLDQTTADGLTMIPVFTEMRGPGDISCPYTKRMSKKVSREEIYEPHGHILDNLREPLQSIFGLHQNVVKEIKYGEVSSFVDILVAKLFEGIQIDFDFSIP
jgi:hypothetical protein